MRAARRVAGVALVVAVAFTAGRASGQRQDPPATSPLSDMAWLAGDWRGDDGRGGAFLAHYTSPEGGRVLSVSKLVRAGRLEFFEFEVFSAEGEQVVLRPYPLARPAASFTRAETAERRAVFVNPENDFPSRIEYAREADELTIRLTGAPGGQPTEQVLRLRRAP